MHRVSIRRVLEMIAPLAALVVLIGATALAERLHNGGNSFLTAENGINVLQQWSVVGVIALGMTLVIILGGIDLSVGSLTALAGGCGIWVMNTIIGARSLLAQIDSAKDFEMASPVSSIRATLAHQVVRWHLDGNEQWGVSIGIATMLLVGGFAGWLNGMLIARGKLAPFITTLGGLAAYRSLALSVVDGGSFDSLSTTILPAIGSRWHTVPYLVIGFITLASVFGIVLNRTRYGRYVIAIGCNERTARYSAIDVARMKLITYTISGLLCGVGGVMIAARFGSVASASTGSLYELDAIAAVVIGGTRMGGGSGTIFGTLIGIAMLGVIGNMLSFLDVSPYLQGLVKGVIIVAAVLLQRVGKNRESE